MIQRAHLNLILIVFCFIMAATAFAKPGKPNFSPAIYADGEVWGTKGTADLPPPNEHNLQSFDKLFMFTGDAAPGQLPVAEAAPRRIFNVPCCLSNNIEQHDLDEPLDRFERLILAQDKGFDFQ